MKAINWWATLGTTTCSSTGSLELGGVEKRCRARRMSTMGCTCTGSEECARMDERMRAAVCSVTFEVRLGDGTATGQGRDRWRHPTQAPPRTHCASSCTHGREARARASAVRTSLLYAHRPRRRDAVRRGRPGSSPRAHRPLRPGLKVKPGWGRAEPRAHRRGRAAVTPGRPPAAGAARLSFGINRFDLRKARTAVVTLYTLCVYLFARRACHVGRATMLYDYVLCVW